MTQDLSHIWPQIQVKLKAAVGLCTYEIWLAPLRVVAFDGEHLDVTAPAELCAWVSDRFDGVMDRAATDVLATAVVVRVHPDLDEVDSSTSSRRAGLHNPVDARDGDQAPPPVRDDIALNPKFTFDQFVIGDPNRFAHASALAVAELPAQAYNPLFIYGPPGVGKTHLLHAIGNYVSRYSGGLTVRYTTVERFTNEFVWSLKAGGRAINHFKDRYRRPDVLLIDDIQFLQAKAKTEEEFFHTFNALHEAGSQLVMTADRLPGDLDALEHRLRARFASGLVTDIGQPDLPTRLTVLRKRVQHDDLQIGEDDVLLLIAERVTGSVRALEGALIRVVAFASLTGQTLNRALAEQVLDGLYRREGAPGTPLRAVSCVTVPGIQALVCDVFCLTSDELLSSERSARLVWPRHVAMYLARHHTSETLPAIGRHFGGRKHTTVMHAVKTTARRIAEDRADYDLVHSLTARLHGVDPDRPD